MWLIGEIYYRNTGKDGLGIGDDKRFGAGAVLLGPTLVPQMILFLLPSGYHRHHPRQPGRAWQQRGGTGAARPRLLVPMPAAVLARPEPHQQAFSKLKAHLRRIGAKTFTEVFEAIGSICDLYDPEECWN